MRTEVLATVLSIAASQDGAVAVAQLRRAGLSAKAQRSAVATGWLRPARPGVVALAHWPRTWRQRLRAGLLALDGTAWVSHDAAAALHGLDGAVETVEFTVARADRGRALGRALHTTEHVAPGDIVEVAGLSCASIPRAVLDVAALGIPEDRLRRLVTAATGVVGVDAVHARIRAADAAGRRGVRRLERLLAA